MTEPAINDAEERSLEVSLRPASLGEYIGQGEAKRSLTTLLQAARERGEAADENILNSTRSTDFITPKSRTSRAFRDATLQLAQHHAFARKLVNSGRLSMPSFLTVTRLNTPDSAAFAGDMVPGAPMDDAPLQQGGRATWLLDHLGHRFQCLLFVDDVAQVDAATRSALQALSQAAIAVDPLVLSLRPGTLDGVAVLVDDQGLFAKRYDAKPGSTWLTRPDQHVCARWRHFDAEAVRAALARATCNA